ncbi:MAG: glycogen/starch synthase [Bacteroidales bacterium]|jgi:starch synthase|nr:glycogen/starch synthase [Bacteroidales bacterium]
MRVLFIAQEVTPYLPETEMSVICRNLPQGIQEQGKEIRTFMPRYGCINERRNQLHEVIRLSGMNLIISDTDHPLIIKVASIQSARMQVYFIDNEDYFGRKNILFGEEDDFFPDNDERAIFFARGVLETIRKLRWVPNIVHCHGWFTSLVPLYVKKAFREDPLFSKSKVILSVYNEAFDHLFSPDFKTKALIDGVTKKDVATLADVNYVAINKLAVNHSDGFVLVGNAVHPEIIDYIQLSKKPFILHNDSTYIGDYGDFYDRMLR